MIAIVDYGLGNVRAFVNIYKNLGLECRAATTARELEGATHLVLPGVGAFDHAMDLLDRSGMHERLDQLVLKDHVPVMGVCVGMQMLANESEEGDRPGLGWIGGTVRKFDRAILGDGWPIPHMGWNTVVAMKPDLLFGGMGQAPSFYFLHSFFFECSTDGLAVGKTEYGSEFASVVRSANVCGVQFHPEKSHEDGTLLLKNFGRS